MPLMKAIRILMFDSEFEKNPEFPSSSLHINIQWSSFQMQFKHI